MNMAPFFVAFVLLMGAMNYYSYRRFLVRLTPRLPRWVTAGLPLLLQLGEILFAVEAATRFVIDSPLVYGVLASSIAFSFLLFNFALLYDLLLQVSRRIPFDRGRRRFIKLGFDVTMLIAALAYLARGLVEGLRTPRVKRVDVAIPDFPFDDYNVVQLSDLHIGRFIQGDFLQRVVERTNALEPDLVVITGDLVDLPIGEVENYLEPLRELRAPAYFVLGNHEYFHGPHAILEGLERLGLRTLVNESVRIGGAGGFELVGLADRIGARVGMLAPDPARAFAAADPQRPTLVLAHQPKMLERLGGYRWDLMLSGHTHGGQIFPFGLLVMVDQPYLAGLHRTPGGGQIYVSRGAGTWGPPMRVLAPAEITHIVLRRA